MVTKRVRMEESHATGDEAVGVAKVRWKNAVYLAQRFGGIVKFGERVGISKQQASHLWGARPVRNIGTANARRIEKAAGVPPGWLDVDHGVAEQSAPARAEVFTAPGRPLVSFATAMSGLRPAARITDWIHQRVPGLDSPSVQLITDGGSMGQTMPPGSAGILDASVTALVDDGVYLLDFSGVRVLRRAALQLDGSWVLSSESKGSEPVRIERGQHISVIGKLTAVVVIQPA